MTSPRSNPDFLDVLDDVVTGHDQAIARDHESCPQAGNLEAPWSRLLLGRRGSPNWPPKGELRCGNDCTTVFEVWTLTMPGAASRARMAKREREPSPTTTASGSMAREPVPRSYAISVRLLSDPMNCGAAMTSVRPSPMPTMHPVRMPSTNAG